MLDSGSFDNGGIYVRVIGVHIFNFTHVQFELKWYIQNDLQAVGGTRFQGRPVGVSVIGEIYRDDRSGELDEVVAQA